MEKSPTCCKCQSPAGSWMRSSVRSHPITTRQLSWRRSREESGPPNESLSHLANERPSLTSWSVLVSFVYRTTNRSEEHTSELQSRSDLVCRLLLEKKKKNKPATAP